MKLLVVILLLSASALGQEGIPGNIGTEKFPPILVGGTERDATQRSRIAALQDAVEMLTSLTQHGKRSINELLAIQTELAIAQLETTDDAQERLDFVQEAYFAALDAWRRTNGMLAARTRGKFDEAQARAAVFAYRVIWLKESMKKEAFQ